MRWLIANSARAPRLPRAPSARAALSALAYRELCARAAPSARAVRARRAFCARAAPSAHFVALLAARAPRIPRCISKQIVFVPFKLISVGICRAARPALKRCCGGVAALFAALFRGGVGQA
jgi:hypothetical protein